MTKTKTLAPKLPADESAELVVLGLLIDGNRKSGEMFESIAPEDFFDIRHQTVYRTILAMWEKNKEISLPLIIGRLASSEQLETAGGQGYVAAIGDGLPKATEYEPYKAILKSKRVLRDAARLAADFEDAAFDADRSGMEASELIDSFLEKLAALGKRAESEDRGETNQEAAIKMMWKLDHYDEQVRIYTGLPTVDDTTGGFREGELVLVTAETGVGKTFFALQIAKKACAAGKHVVYASGEMLAEHLMGRTISSETGIEYWKIRRPEKLTKEDRAELMKAVTHQCPTCRILSNELTLPRIRMSARSMASNKELGAIIVDYDELVDVRGKDEWEQQRVLVRSLKKLAMELGVPAILVSQLRKESEGQTRKKPSLSRLYGSGAKVKHASLVLHVDRPFVRDLEGDEAAASVAIMKSRDGKLGKVPCKFNVRSLRFEE